MVAAGFRRKVSGLISPEKRLIESRKVKVAFIVNKFPVLTETFILNQVTGLLNAGHDVQIYTHSIEDKDGIHPDIARYHLMERVHSFSYPWNKLLRVLKAIYLLLIHFHKDPAKVLQSLNVFLYGTSVMSLKPFYYILPFLNTEYDIIHCHFGTNGPIGVLLKEMGVKGKIVTTFYGLDMSVLPKIENWHTTYKKLFREGDLFLVEGSHMRQELTKIGCPANKIRIQHIMVDRSNIAFRKRELKTIDEKFVMMFCGRFVEKKGLIYGLKALELLLPKYPNLEWRIIGNGELMPEIQQYIETHNLEKWVVLLGYQPHRVFIEECQNADILLQPSVVAENGDCEGGAPTVLLEAQASGLPIVATHHADIPEVVADGKSGLLAKERNVEDLANKIEYLLTQPELRVEMGQFGQRHIESNYSIQSEIRKLENLYRQTV